MKYIILSLFLSASANAGGIACALPDSNTKMAIQWTEKTVRVEVENPRGYQNMPQFEAPLAQSSLAMMNAQTDDLASLGEGFGYEWPREKCEFSPDNKRLISCHGKSKLTRGDTNVDGRLFSTAEITENSLYGLHTVLRLRLILARTAMYFVAIPFPISLCKDIE